MKSVDLGWCKKAIPILSPFIIENPSFCILMVVGFPIRWRTIPHEISSSIHSLHPLRKTPKSNECMIIVIFINLKECLKTIYIIVLMRLS